DGEYRLVSTYLASHGILHRVSCPHTPQQNDSAERLNRSVIEKGLALLAHSNLPIKFWENAFHTTVYVNNRTITPNLSFKSPYESLYAKQPDYGFLKSFGFMCYPFILPYNRTKLEYGSLPCIFIDYRPKHKGYCCYHIPFATTYIVRDVIFYETNFPYSTLSSMPNDSSVSPQLATLPLHLLQHACRVTLMSSSLPHSSEPSPPSPPISAQPSPTTSHTVSSTPPSHPTTDQPPPSPSPSPVESCTGAPSYYRVAANSEHTMVTRASTSSLKPKIFHTTKHPSPIDPTVIIEPKFFIQASKNPNWQHAMPVEYDALMSNRTWDLVPQSEGSNIVGYKWISDAEGCRSQHGFAIYYGGNLISWSSRKQKVVARSSTEAEYRAIDFATTELVWIRELLTELGAPFTGPSIVLCDNLIATFLSAYPVLHQRSKHIKLDYHYVRELVQAGQLLFDMFGLTTKWLTYLPRLWAPPVSNLYDGVFVSGPTLEIVGGYYL
ncbi:hypothetical protein V2J09_017770, partial [Rumex salicifolius]